MRPQGGVRGLESEEILGRSTEGFWKERLGHISQGLPGPLGVADNPDESSSGGAGTVPRPPVV
eukprot:7609569-Pyramimonas_sp.AAC.1